MRERSYRDQVKPEWSLICLVICIALVMIAVMILAPKDSPDTPHTYAVCVDGKPVCVGQARDMNVTWIKSGWKHRLVVTEESK